MGRGDTLMPSELAAFRRLLIDTYQRRHEAATAQVQAAHSANVRRSLPSATNPRCYEPTN